MRICPKCNGSGVRFAEREQCVSCNGTGREREYALGLPPGIVELDQLPKAERVKLAGAMAIEIAALTMLAVTLEGILARDEISGNTQPLRDGLKAWRDSTSAKDTDG